MQEMLAPTTAIKGVGLGDTVRILITDGRFSGGTANALDRPCEPRGRGGGADRVDQRRRRSSRSTSPPAAFFVWLFRKPSSPSVVRRGRNRPSPIYEGLAGSIRRHGNQRGYRGDSEVVLGEKYRHGLCDHPSRLSTHGRPDPGSGRPRSCFNWFHLHVQCAIVAPRTVGLRGIPIHSGTIHRTGSTRRIVPTRVAFRHRFAIDRYQVHPFFK